MSQPTKPTLLLSIITIATLLLVQQCTASCGVCGSNGIACISQTQFYICFNNQPDTSTTFTCPNNGTCTALAAKCFEAAGAPADCEPATAAGTCGCTATSDMFACTSRTTYAQCNGATVVVPNVSCPNNTVCSTAGGGEICKELCPLNTPTECNLDAPAS